MIFSKDLPIDDKYPLSCVYWIYDKEIHTDPRVSGYVGVSIHGVVSRMYSHTNKVKSGSHLKVHNAMRKHGDNIAVKVLLLADPEFCLLTEHMLRPVPYMKGTWNVNSGGGKGQAGTIRSEESKAKQSKTMTGVIRSLEHCENISKSLKGKPKSEAHKAALSALKLGEDPWKNSRANKELWASAAEVYSYYAANPSHGVQKMAKHFSRRNGAMCNMLDNLREGWVPSEDTAYMCWLTEYKQKETADAVT